MFIRRLYTPKPLDTPAHTRTVMSYADMELALLVFKAHLIQYKSKHGCWPKLAPHDSDYPLVWL